MATDTKSTLKQFRVDNWAIFFLQRLQLLFAKGDLCDLTLKFHTGEELKAHRLILNTCTTYFETLEINDNVIMMPETLNYNALHPVINFLYSGRLEFKPELYDQLLSVSQTLNLTILSQLLVSQKNDNGITSTAIAVSKDVIKKIPIRGQSVTKISVKSPSQSKTIEGKRLPIWRPRTTLPYLRQFKRKQIKEDEDPRPTRFDWPVDDVTNNLLMQSPSFSSLSYDSTPVIPSSQANTPSQPQQFYKRRIISSTPISEKFFKPNKTENNVEKNSPSEDKDLGDISDDDDGHFETLHTYGDSDDDTPQENQLKPILKPSSEAATPTPNKKVRFSFVPEEKEKPKEDEEKPKNSVKDGEKDEPAPATSITVPVEKEKSEPVSNHAKIIAEVLKKYPELVKNNKNIKLKITAPGFSPKTTISMTTKKSLSGKSSYVVIKSSKGKDDTKPEETTSKKPAAKSEWICKSCVTDDSPTQFSTYFDYRKHLENVHNELIDSRICEYCGYKASKRNLHLYHLYTKHDVPPPKNFKFPKCEQCNYVALSELLLTKHLNSHQTQNKEFVCSACEIGFKTSTTYQAHKATCKGTSANMVCEHCRRKFRTVNSLNAHLRICSDKPSNIFDDEMESEEQMEIDVPDDKETIVELPSTIILEDQQQLTLMPSSESEALSNVASGIATSIGLTVALPQDQVILLEGNSEFYIQDHETQNEAELFVPETIDNDMTQIYSTPFEGESEVQCTVIDTLSDPKPGPSKKVEQYGKKSTPKVETQINLETPIIFDTELDHTQVIETNNVNIDQTPMEIVVEGGEELKEPSKEATKIEDPLKIENTTNVEYDVPKLRVFSPRLKLPSSKSRGLPPKLKFISPKRREEPKESEESKAKGASENEKVIEEVQDSTSQKVLTETSSLSPEQKETTPEPKEVTPEKETGGELKNATQPKETSPEPQLKENTPEPKDSPKPKEKTPEPKDSPKPEEKIPEPKEATPEPSPQPEESETKETSPEPKEKSPESKDLEETSPMDLETEETSEEPTKVKDDETVKANTFVKDWGFDNDEDSQDMEEDVDPEGKPCRINEDL